MGLTICPMQVQKRPRQRRCIRTGQPQIRQRRGDIGQDRIGHRLAHVRNQTFAVARRQFRDVKAEFLRQR